MEMWERDEQARLQNLFARALSRRQGTTPVKETATKRKGKGFEDFELELPNGRVVKLAEAASAQATAPLQMHEAAEKQRLETVINAFKKIGLSETAARAAARGRG